MLHLQAWQFNYYYLIWVVIHQSLAKNKVLNYQRGIFFCWTPPRLHKNLNYFIWKIYIFLNRKIIAKTQWEQISYAIWPLKVVKFVQIFTCKLLEDQFETKQHWLRLIIYFFLFLCHTPFLLANFHMGIRWIRWHVYVTEQVVKIVNQIKRVNNLQRMMEWMNVYFS